MEIKREWTLVAPLGELPDWPTIKNVGSFVEKSERRYRKRTLSGDCVSYTLIVGDALEGVRGTEGVLSLQLDGGGVPAGFNRVSGFVGSSVLVVAGAHGDRSVYVVRYGRDRMWVNRGYTQGRKVPDYTRDLLAELHKNPEARKELEVLEGKLSERYPALKTALEKLEGRDRPFFVEAVGRGQLLFLVTQTGRITHALIGTSLLPLRHFYEKDMGWGEEALAGLLHEEASLKPLPPEVIEALLQGKGDVAKAERRLALAHLAKL
jgi:hypothetical protein